jgi:hypothetical protein
MGWFEVLAGTSRRYFELLWFEDLEVIVLGTSKWLEKTSK